MEGSQYFEIFREQSDGFVSHRSFGDRHVSVLDDHDHFFGSKIRFSAEIPDYLPAKDYQVLTAIALQLFSLGIPCLYNGTEQAFAGPVASQVQYLLDKGWKSNDRYLRESMFGPEHPRANITESLETQLKTENTSLPGFGPFGTTGKHCFDTQSPAYIRISSLCKIRAAHPVLRLGRQFLRQIQLPGTGFEFPKAGQLVAWSRILHDHEAVSIVNPNGLEERGGDIVVAAELSLPGTEYVVIANSRQAAQGEALYIGSHPIGSKVSVRGLNKPGEPAFIEIRHIQPAEVLVLIRVR